MLGSALGKLASTYGKGIVKTLAQAAAKETASVLSAAFKQTFTSNIRLDFLEDPLAYKVGTEWVTKNCRSARNNMMVRVTAHYMSQDCVDYENWDRFMLAPGDYWFIYKQRIHGVLRKFTVRAFLRDPVHDESGMQNYKLIITIFGDGKHYLSNIIYTMIRDARDGRQVVINHENLRNSAKRYTALRDFSSIVLNPATEHKILKHIEWFKDNKSYFTQHGLTYKTAILLKGPPGTGKTSICRALANYMNYDIFILNMSALCDRGNRLAQLPKIPEKSLILVEDIDKSIDSTNMQAVQILMQMLDGMLSCDNTLFTITTNFPEKLPEELIRPGRINLQVDVGLFTRDEALRLGRMYDVPDNIISCLPEATWTHPSALHEFILGYSNDRQEHSSDIGAESSLDA